VQCCDGNSLKRNAENTRILAKILLYTLHEEVPMHFLAASILAF